MLNVYSPYYVKYDIPGIARTSGYRPGYASAISIFKSVINSYLWARWWQDRGEKEIMVLLSPINDIRGDDLCWRE